MNIRYLGHSAFQIATDKYNILIDPWVSGNPKSPLKNIKELEDITHCLVTHEHQDHGLPDAVEICKITGAVLIGAFETMSQYSEEVAVSAGNTGGRIRFSDDDFIYFTQAFHTTKSNQPLGFILRLNGKTLYHAGDTALFSDMRLFNELFDIDVALLPIGDLYTMGPFEAAKAVEFIEPKVVVPMHYDTFPVLTGQLPEFEKFVRNDAEVKGLKPGESFDL